MIVLLKAVRRRRRNLFPPRRSRGLGQHEDVKHEMFLAALVSVRAVALFRRANCDGSTIIDEDRERPRGATLHISFRGGCDRNVLKIS